MLSARSLMYYTVNDGWYVISCPQTMTQDISYGQSRCAALKLTLHQKATTVSLCFSGGIMEGDVIVKLNGRPVRTTEDIHAVLQQDGPLLLEVRRGNDDLLFNIHPQVILH